MSVCKKGETTELCHICTPKMNRIYETKIYSYEVNRQMAAHRKGNTSNSKTMIIKICNMEIFPIVFAPLVPYHPQQLGRLVSRHALVLSFPPFIESLTNS